MTCLLPSVIELSFFIVFYTFVCYFKKHNQICHKSIFIISDHLIHEHDTNIVYTFQRHVIKELKNVISRIEKIIYFSDGASSQYKNKKNFINICKHKYDFDTAAEWNLFASLHRIFFYIGRGWTVKLGRKKGEN